MVQEEESAPTVLGDVPYMHRDRDDQRVGRQRFVWVLYADTLTHDRFDSSMMNGLQAVPTWDACTFSIRFV